MLEILKELCLLDGTSGREEKIREYIIAKIKDKCEYTVDLMGNIIADVKGKLSSENKVMLSAHMDEVGFIVTYICDNGFLKFTSVGGVDSKVVNGRHVTVGENRINGVIGSKALHLCEGDEEHKVSELSKMYIDIGASSKEEAEKLVEIGDAVYFKSDFVEFGNSKIKAKAIDDRVGCAVMMDIIKQELPVDCWFAFTVQEEVGTRGAFGAAFRVKPDVCLVVEGTTAADLPSVQGMKKICAPKKGVVVPFMDRGAIYDKNLHKFVTKLADENGIKWQVKSMIAGGTDAQAIQRSRAGVRAVGIAAAIRNIHSPASTASIEDIKGLRTLAQLFLENIEAELN